MSTINKRENLKSILRVYNDVSQEITGGSVGEPVILGNKIETDTGCSISYTAGNTFATINSNGAYHISADVNVYITDPNLYIKATAQLYNGETPIGYAIEINPVCGAIHTETEIVVCENCNCPLQRPQISLRISTELGTEVNITNVSFGITKLA